MRLDETPQDIELVRQVDDHVVLFEVGGHLAERFLVSILCLLLALAVDHRVVFANCDVFRVLEREASQVFDGLGLGGREEEGLARFRQVTNDGVERRGETHVEDAICLIEDCGVASWLAPPEIASDDVKSLTEKLEMIAFEAERLIHVLQQASRRRDEDVHPRQPLLLVLEVLAANDETGRELVVAANLAEHLEDLYCLRGDRTSSVRQLTVAS